ncbi:hypothetical protein H7849_09090 [Alloacidobacterium dinghuense]|uniref:Polymer-forming cytoskeletal protein n=1 Tax=Alloacidobacterium dinghuense TaxID=2763107 RepID=A0A7G8BNB5_9BACT|nr:hypothetical protein [Alloacidobacterium dinghuense]QNI34035.1 hypothetical protein H7849_09090 [Alloacidobacterium dinghuense]
MSRRWLYLCFPILLGILFIPRAQASTDRVSFMHDIDISDTDEADDAVCFLCSIRVNGKVNGDAVAFLGGIHVNGEINGDAVSFLGDVAMGDQSRIGGDCVVFGGPLRRTGNATVNGDTVNFPFIIIMLPFIFVALLIYGVIALFRRRRYAAYPMPPPTMRR